MKRTLMCTLSFLFLAGCTPERRSPDAIRQDTATATAAAARDAKAVVQGIAEGLKQKGPININKASSRDLQTLPGIDSSTAKEIIAGRPYEASGELLRKHIVSKTEYNRIASKVVAK